MSNLESVRTYEGTDEVHTLILGNAITGIPPSVDEQFETGQTGRLQVMRLSTDRVGRGKVCPLTRRKAKGRGLCPPQC